MITDPRLFVGRHDELQFLIHRMTLIQPISVNIVGERRIGKSSLLYRFYQIWSQWVDDPQKYIVIFHSLQDGRYRREWEFYTRISQELKTKLPPHQCPQEDVNDHAEFAELIDCLGDMGVLPVLCLDEFDALFEPEAQFYDAFFDNLRSLMDRGRLMLILASHEDLVVYKRRKRLTSSFFNVGQKIRLDYFSEEEALDLVRIPASTVPGAQAALSIDEQQTALEWGKRHPYLLQLAATYLCRARQEGKTLEWANQMFETHAKGLPHPHYWRKHLFPLFTLPFRALWQLPLFVGKLASWLGLRIDDMLKWLAGAFLLLVAFLSLTGRIDQDQIMRLIEKLLGD